MTDDTAARIAAEVAARYGVKVDPRVVQVIPRGVSGQPLPVFNGRHLVEADPAQGKAEYKRRMWAGATKRALPAAVAERRQRIIALHGEGKTVAEMAAALGITDSLARMDLSRMNLAAHIAPDPRSAAMQARRQRVAELRAQGMTAEAIAAEIGGVSAYTIADDLRAMGLPRMRRRVNG